MRPGVRRTGRLVGAVAIGGQPAAGLRQITASHAVDPLEPILQCRDRSAISRRDRNALGIDRLIEAGDRRRHALGVEFVRLAAIDLASIGDAIGDMQHRIGVGEAGEDRMRRGDGMREQR
jgi:hypothetical protein